MRRVVIVALILIGLFVATDFVLRKEAESRAAREIAANLDLAAGGVDVNIEGFPFVTQAVGGHLSRVTFESEGVREKGFELDRVTAHLDDVRFELGSVLAGKGSVRARSGAGSAIASASALNDRLQAELPGQGAIDLRGDRAIFNSDTVGEVPATVALDGDALVVNAEGIPAVSLSLPRLGAGLSFESAEVRNGRLVLTFTLGGSALRIS